MTWTRARLDATSWMSGNRVSTEVEPFSLTHTLGIMRKFLAYLMMLLMPMHALAAGTMGVRMLGASQPVMAAQGDSHHQSATEFVAKNPLNTLAMAQKVIEKWLLPCHGLVDASNDSADADASASPPCAACSVCQSPALTVGYWSQLAQAQPQVQPRSTGKSDTSTEPRLAVQPPRFHA